ncbi:MAG: hypothetical protein Q8R88_04825 [Desulfoprunum sp.]|nr:hypothetical protein [Desulfoprunum sp.]
MLNRSLACWALVFPLFFSGCGATGYVVPPPSYARYFKELPCVDRIGRCFDASIGGRPVTVIADKARHEQITRMAQEANDEVRNDIYWEVQELVDGNQILEVRVVSNALGLTEVGEPKEDPELMIYPLDNQSLESEEELVASTNVSVEGQPIVARQDTLTEQTLPPGRYIVAIRYSGRHNWERKQVFVTVK